MPYSLVFLYIAVRTPVTVQKGKCRQGGLVRYAVFAGRNPTRNGQAVLQSSGSTDRSQMRSGLNAAVAENTRVRKLDACSEMMSACDPALYHAMTFGTGRCRYLPRYDECEST